jgi:hypothetical protein
MSDEAPSKEWTPEQKLDALYMYVQVLEDENARLKEEVAHWKDQTDRGKKALERYAEIETVARVNHANAERWRRERDHAISTMQRMVHDGWKEPNT